MRIVSNALLIVSGVYLALGLIYLRFWWAERARLAYLAFTISCFSYLLFSSLEFGMMKATTPEEYLFYAWWAFLPGSVGLLSFAWFAYLHLHGRKWLFVTYGVMRILSVLLHLIMANGINFRQVTSIVSRTVLGEPLAYPIAVRNPWMVLPHLSHVLLIMFFLDASIRCWRRGERRQSITFGTGTILFGSTLLFFALSVLWGLVPIPIMASFAVLFIVAPVLYELNFDMHRAAMLTETLEERDTRLTETLEQLQLSASAGNVGLWTRKIGEETIWVNEKAGEIWGSPSGEQFTRNDFFKQVHADDRALLITLIRELEEGKNEFQLEYRMVSEVANVRWIHSRGKVEAVNGSRIIRGAIVDITKLKMAQEAVQELSRKLMNAQEKERARMALELHDDLNQSIALLSIHMTVLRNKPKNLEYVKDQLDQLISDVYRLAGDVRRISQELHPARLSLLGLEAALHGSCRELAAAHLLEISFEAENLPRNLPEDISLCLYRVTQEALQNVIKHSEATSAHVSIKSEQGKIHLSVSDNGNGFDLEAAKARESLGLISIDERVRAVKGEANIISAVGGGTKIEVQVPVGNDSEDVINVRQY